jgi:predicted O-linked N-acetylglucosamine transferase (SPINDLY family)
MYLLENRQHFKDQLNQQDNRTVRGIRRQIAERWLNTPLSDLEATFQGSLGQAHQIILNLGSKRGITYVPIAEEIDFLNSLLQILRNGRQDPRFTAGLLGVMLYRRADQLPIMIESIFEGPDWVLQESLDYLLHRVSLFVEPDEAEGYYHYTARLIDFIYGHYLENQDSPYWQSIVSFTANHLDLLPLHSTSCNLRSIVSKRGDILQWHLINSGHEIHYLFPHPNPDHHKLSLGVLAPNFGPAPEIFATLPTFEYLDRSKFEIILYSLQAIGHPLEQYCRSRADDWIILPETLTDQVERIRANDLDFLIHATGICSRTYSITLLAAHRLARIQVALPRNSFTTGINTIDYFLSGSLAESPHGAQDQYREQLIALDGPAHCFHYDILPTKSALSVTRQDWGISPQSVIFFSGSAIYKLIPEVRELWLQILVEVPNSYLVLACMAPARVKVANYPVMTFFQLMQTRMSQLRIAPSRLLLLKPLPGREHVKQCIQLTNIYLDSFPHSGSHTLVDALEVSVPTVVMDGNSFRSKHGASFLRELQIPDLIANSQDEYLKIAVRLASDPDFRQQKQTQIRHAMQANPRFLDSRAYSTQVGSVLQTLWDQYLRSS